MSSEDDAESTVADRSEDDAKSTVADPKAKNLVRSQYYNVMVKVDEDVYCLDKLQLALKSDYFEKLFVKYSDQEECSVIELPVMDTDTFSIIVDIIYGQTLTSALNHDNFVALLMAMDYLHMEIDLKMYADFVDKISGVDVKVFKLYNFVRENPYLQDLLPSVLTYVSDHLASMQNYDDFLHLALDHVVQIVLSYRNDPSVKPGHRINILEGSFRKDMRMISRMCSKWICYDLESRLPHAAKLVNAAKRRFNYLNEIKEGDFDSASVDITEEMNAEVLTKLFHKFLLCDGEVKPAREELLEHERKSLPPTPSSSGENKRKKLVENGCFHDVVVRVGEETFKLHRYMLNQHSGYFAEIFSAEKSNVEASIEQPKSIKNEYSLEAVDQTTFHTIVQYIYFDKLQLTRETVLRVLEAASILKMEKLFSICMLLLQENIEQVFTIDEGVSASWFQDNIEEIYAAGLIKHDEAGNTFLKYLISIDMLEDLLLSSSSCCCEDASKIVDFCSKWVFHDVQNRYRLIPEIALAINHSRNNYKMDATTDFNNCSEQLIRDELWKALRSTVLVPSAERTPENGENNVHVDEVPVFVALTHVGEYTIHVLNANMEEIASLHLSIAKLTKDDNEKNFCIAATSIDDNLFIMSSLGCDCSCVVFYVYNSRLKTFVSLNNGVEVEKPGLFSKFWLLNCRGQVYCCFKNGLVLKYLIELNRWMIFSKEPTRSAELRCSAGQLVWFASDGDKLYRLYVNNVSRAQNSLDLLYYVVDEFNFQQDAWVSMPDFSFSKHNLYVKNLTFIDGKLSMVSFSEFFSFDQNSRMWREISLTNNRAREYEYERRAILVQCEDGLLQVIGNKLYQWCQRNQRWVMKKKLPSRFEFVPSVPAVDGDREVNRGIYDRISAIHTLFAPT